MTKKKTSWLEVSLRVTSELAEAVSAALQPLAHQGVALELETPDPDADPETAIELHADAILSVRAYLALESNREELQLEVERVLWPLRMIARESGLTLPAPEFKPVQNADWAELWKSHYRPLQVGEQLLIVPVWEQVEINSDDIAIYMDPGQAFGTGVHPTTQLCLAAIERYLHPGQRVLDLGCGAGILSIAAAKLGAARVDGLDIDPVAVQATQENAVVNNVAPTVNATLGSLAEALQRSAYELVVANILSKVVIEMLHSGLADTIAEGGVVILSGILVEQVDEVRVAMEAQGLKDCRLEQLEDWAALIARKM